MEYCTFIKLQNVNTAIEHFYNITQKKYCFISVCVRLKNIEYCKFIKILIM